MRRIMTTLVIMILAALLLLVRTPPFRKRLPKDVNVIMLTVDSLRPDHLGCYGYSKMKSPNIDAIAASGQLFRRAYCQSAWTIPGVMSIITSLYPPVHQVDERGDMLDPNITTMFDCFREAGYRVPNICFLLTVPEFSTIRVGPVEEKYFSGEDGEELIRWLDENHDSKFFVWYLYRGVHLPYRPKQGADSIVSALLPDEEPLSSGIRAVLSDAAVVPVGTASFQQSDRSIVEGLYDGEIGDLDVFVGRLFHRLRRYGLLQKTLVVITADHGEELLDHGFVGHASTMHSATLYDEILRIPLIMSLPGYLPQGVEIQEQVQQIDIMPTVLGILNLPVPAGIQGRNLAPLLFGSQKQAELSVPVFAETVYGGYQATEEMAETRLRSVRTDAWKLIETDAPQGKTYQLFDLPLDTREHTDVYAENRQAASALKILLMEWSRENTIRGNAIKTRGVAVSRQDRQAICPEMIFPYDGVVLRYGEREGMVRASWAGSPNSTYIIEYEIGTGVHHLTGSFVAFGNRRDFGPYSREIWSSIAVRNPWRVRISPDTHPRCWNEWIQFTFE